MISFRKLTLHARAEERIKARMRTCGTGMEYGGGRIREGEVVLIRREKIYKAYRLFKGK